ncbi:phosphotransferase family protein [Haloarchaeobius sp. HME9146]|uniref:phosphotransferase family protein n=1 Tax=Haloarchaeobius sp. HME9146 TaxID=2978732 RepID=UPI0021BED926|nr:phosphotransferase family protein [Haloarchaeobius sp. HME9146]MCT9096744.1 phosphotransferase family protein [Haloarchaeobius sp. HME9146]
MPESATPIDTTALEAFLADELGTTVTSTEVLADGLNLVIAVETEQDRYVVRRPNKLRETSYINDLRTEYEVMERLRDTPVPAPTPVLFYEDDAILGDSFLVLTALDGDPVPLGSDLPNRFQNPSARRRVGETLIDSLTEIHAVETAPFEGVCDHLRPRDQVDRCIRHLEAATAATGHEIPGVWDVAAWLQDHAPETGETTLIHGDFRPGNVLFSGTDEPEITGVLDWETAMLGDPLVELGYLLLRWRDEGDPTPPLDDLAARYPDHDAIAHLRDVNENGLSPFTAEPGSPTRRELVARYEDRTGYAFENQRFYRALAPFMLVTVWEDLHRHRVEAGADSDWAPHIEHMTMLAEQVVDGSLGL